ncbi:unnamed protein product [Rhizophagus irregularis]|nr:unnamed protein product [Rhizophagus irregularis]
MWVVASKRRLNNRILVKAPTLIMFGHNLPLDITVEMLWEEKETAIDFVHMIKNCVVDHIVYIVLIIDNVFLLSIRSKPIRRGDQQLKRGLRLAKQTGLIFDLQASSSEDYNC